MLELVVGMEELERIQGRYLYSTFRQHFDRLGGNITDIFEYFRSRLELHAVRQHTTLPQLPFHDSCMAHP